MISKALLRWTKTGGVDLVPEPLSQLYGGIPPTSCFSQWGTRSGQLFDTVFVPVDATEAVKVKLYCPQPGCDNQELASAVINQKIRQVIDIDGFYNMACDNLECMRCRRRVHSIKVVRFLGIRGLGNSCSQIQKKPEEQHGEKWLQTVLHYLTAVDFPEQWNPVYLSLHHLLSQQKEYFSQRIHGYC